MQSARDLVNQSERCSGPKSEIFTEQNRRERLSIPYRALVNQKCEYLLKERVRDLATERVRDGGEERVRD